MLPAAILAGTVAMTSSRSASMTLTVPVRRVPDVDLAALRVEARAGGIVLDRNLLDRLEGRRVDDRHHVGARVGREHAATLRVVHEADRLAADRHLGDHLARVEVEDGHAVAARARHVPTPALDVDGDALRPVADRNRALRREALRRRHVLSSRREAAERGGENTPGGWPGTLCPIGCADARDWRARRPRDAPPAGARLKIGSPMPGSVSPRVGSRRRALGGASSPRRGLRATAARSR